MHTRELVERQIRGIDKPDSRLPRQLAALVRSGAC
jgi:hypothetical protein